MLGEVHVLAILRDPVKRAISNWRFSTDNGLETRSLETALSENLAGPRAWDPSRTSVSPFAYLERGRYVDYLDPVDEHLPGDLARAVPRGAPRRRPPPGRRSGRLSGWPRTSLRETSDDAVNQSPGAPPVLSGEILGTLEAYFEKSNRALSAHLGRELPW